MCYVRRKMKLEVDKAPMANLESWRLERKPNDCFNYGLTPVYSLVPLLSARDNLVPRVSLLAAKSIRKKTVSFLMLLAARRETLGTRLRQPGSGLAFTLEESAFQIRHFKLIITLLGEWSYKVQVSRHKPYSLVKGVCHGVYKVYMAVCRLGPMSRTVHDQECLSPTLSLVPIIFTRRLFIEQNSITRSVYLPSLGLDHSDSGVSRLFIEPNFRGQK